MKRALALAALTLFLSLAAYAQESAPPKEGVVTKKYDRFKDSTLVTFDAQLSGDYPRGLSVRIVEAFSGEVPTKEPDKLICAFISGGSDLEYAISHDLIFLADGERLKADKSSYVKQTTAGGNYIELILTAVPTGTLRKVANARKAEAQLGHTEFEVTEEQRRNLQQFLAAISPQAAAVQPERPLVAKALQDYLRSGFGMRGYETSWYRNIKGVSVKGDTAEVQTDLQAGDVKAGRICGAVSWFVFSNDNRGLGLTGVRVYGDTGQLLINRSTLAAPCR